MIPPALLQLKIGERRPRIIIPLFLLWPLAIILAPVVLIVCAFYAICTRQMNVLKTGLAFHSLVCSLRGLVVDVKSGEDSVFISIK